LFGVFSAPASTREGTRHVAMTEQPIAAWASIIVSAVGHAGGVPNPWQVGWVAETEIKAADLDADEEESSSFAGRNWSLHDLWLLAGVVGSWCVFTLAYWFLRRQSLGGILDALLFIPVWLMFIAIVVLRQCPRW